VLIWPLGAKDGMDAWSTWVLPGSRDSTQRIYDGVRQSGKRE